MLVMSNIFKNFKDRRELSLTILERARKVLEECFSSHLLSRSDYIFTGTGTGTHDIDVEVVGLTDMQVGSYVMMDVEYLSIGSKESDQSFSSTFSNPPLTLLSSIISTHQFPERVTLDAGTKAIYKDGPPARVVSPALFVKSKYTWAGDEHGYLLFNDSNGIKQIAESGSQLLGQVVELCVSHCDPTINLFDYFYVHQAEKIIDIWPIDMRGKNQ